MLNYLFAENCNIMSLYCGGHGLFVFEINESEAARLNMLSSLTSDHDCVNHRAEFVLKEISQILCRLVHKL